MHPLLEKILAEKTPCVFVSPHLDDAILSCGNLIAAFKGKTNTRVVTLFTEAGEGPETLSARMFLKQCGIPDARALFAARRREDEEVLNLVGATWQHLGFSDALWRTYPKSFLRNLLGKVIPEFLHLYPTYRWHITRGVIAPADRTEIKKLQQKLQEIPRLFPGAKVFFPLGLGKHVDHVLTHQLGLHFSPNVVFYADFPYCLHDAPDEDALINKGYTKVSFSEGGNTKHELIRQYRTQPLFPGEIPSVPEVYFFPH